jgi:hypothetical protein
VGCSASDEEEEEEEVVYLNAVIAVHFLQHIHNLQMWSMAE